MSMQIELASVVNQTSALICSSGMFQQVGFVFYKAWNCKFKYFSISGKCNAVGAFVNIVRSIQGYCKSSHVHNPEPPSSC